ncbi:response regulator transcription factor [Saccharomonospora sp. NB11]|jgi:DNA-binding NarL/FixJ family response regulator|uniref:response regulator transcription factor n=1 Tax=Saccharomonospora sp. NB11 TaxID=1642298 RepID=UPI0018D15982|nr:response regulator transcription factor [Saccharomonospora sp. NB11]
MAHGARTGRGALGLDRATRTLTVAAIDSVPLFREGLSAVVSRTPGLRWGGHAASHHAGIALCDQLRPDVVLVDSALDPHGHLTHLLAEGHPMLAVTVLVDSARRTAAYLATLVDAGAHGVLPRTVDPRQLAEGIRRTYVERHYTDPTLAPLVPKQRTGEASPTRTPMPLSRREYQVLQLIAEGMENSAVADTLFLSVETVRTHVKSILRKLSARDRTHAVTKAFRSGLLVVSPGEDEARSPRL